MSKVRSVVGMVSVAVMALSAGVASGQNFPNKPIRVLTGTVGGGTDLPTRLVAPGLSSNLGQPVNIDNRGGDIPGEIVSKAPPDGYTLLIEGRSIWIGSLLREMPFDPVRDFSPISMVGRSPQILVVHPSVPVKSVKELIALAKARPGELNYSSGSTGGATHLAGELFKSLAGVNIVRIPYASNSQELNELIGGQVQVSFINLALVPYVKSGRLRALAVTNAEPSPLFPGLPTVRASLPGFESGSTTGIWAPAKTPVAIINRLNQEIVRFLKTTEAKEQFFSIGIEPIGSSPEEFAAAIKSEMALWGKLIKDLGIKAN